MLMGVWSASGIATGQTLTFSLRKWDGANMTTVDSWGTSSGGAYITFSAYVTANIPAGHAIFMSARNNTNAAGNLTFARLNVIAL